MNKSIKSNLGEKVESISVSKFKATCLSVLEDVKKQKKRVIITKRGEPIAIVIPYNSDKADVLLKDTVTFVGDIMSPVAEQDWEVLK
jgi:prevent-host-death family protein